MVDFQKRDTKRGPVEDPDEDDEGAENEAGADDERAAEDAASAEPDAGEGEDGGRRPDATETSAGDPTPDAGEQSSGTPDADGPDPDEVEAAIAAREADREDPSSERTAAEGSQAAADAERTATDGARPVEAEPTGDDAAGGEAARAGTADPSRTVEAAVVTVSSGRSHDDDPGGAAVESALEAAGHEVAGREVLRPTYDTVQQAVDALVGREDVDVVVTNGGTGVTPEDVTVEAVNPLFEKALPGFGEVFRSRYYEAAGTDVVRARATAGIADGTPVFCLPGDPTAAKLGAGGLVAEQAPAILAALEADGPEDD